MYKHVLVPTDGSPLANKAVDAAISYAAESGAKVTGYYAIEDMNMHHAGAYLTAELREEFDKRARIAAEEHALEPAKAASAAGVDFDWRISKVRYPHEGIIAAAQEAGSDVIFMATHGHGSIAGVLLGSVTQKVLSHSKIPVLVLR